MKARSILLFLLLLWLSLSVAQSAVLDTLKLRNSDSVLVVEDGGETVFSWQAGKSLVPASLTKLATAHLAIEKWGLAYRFHTDFLVNGETLWVKGYGDPFLVSEELDTLVSQLKASLLAYGTKKITRLNIDNSHFDITVVPGRSAVADPYNAPISAVSANFNTAKLSNKNGRLASAEAQTPLTNTARKMAYSMTQTIERVNLLNADNAQTNFAELLLSKLAWTNVEVGINQRLVNQAQLLYRHENSRTLADVLQGTLEFSNNFMANQLFLKLPENDRLNSVSFAAARDYSNSALARQFGWQHHRINEGSGLSRKNRLTANQIDDLLKVLQPHKRLLKRIKVNSKSAIVNAKTGTLKGVRSYAGYIELPAKTLHQAVKRYRFVFNFNRAVGYRFRDQLLEQLVDDLEAL